MEKFPEAIGSTKNTALHLLLEHNPSLALVDKMINLSNSLSSCATSSSTPSSSLSQRKMNKKKAKRQILEVTDEQDQLPLHVAVEHQASDDVILRILNGYTKAAQRTRESHDQSLPLHCALLFGCSKKVLTNIINAYPQALSFQNSDGNTPLHILFHQEYNIERWTVKKETCCEDENEKLSEESMCSLLLERYVENVPNSLTDLLNKTNGKGHTVVQAAKDCKKKFSVPDSLIQMLEKGQRGVLLSSPPRRGSLKSNGADISNAHNDYDASTNESSSDDSSSDDSSVDLI